jgi:hypothetical protein
VTRLLHILLSTLCISATHALSSGGQSSPDTERVLSVVEFGAVGDSITMNTASIQRAIDSVYARGGGSVVFPGGVFLSGGIVLKSGVTLHLCKDAVLLGSSNPFDYTQGSNHSGLIVADSATRIAVIGEGAIDGQGLDLALTIDSLFHLRQFEDPAYNHDRHRPSERVRPRLLDFNRCSDVRVQAVTLKNSAGWVQVYTRCRRVAIDSVTVESTAYWNNDGIDICDCSDVEISRCAVNSADDGICLKSQSRGWSNERVTITHCTVRSSASAVKFGTDSWGGFKDITVSHITVYDTYRSAIAIECVDGGVIDNVKVSDVHAQNTGNAIFIRLGHRNPDTTVGTIRNITVEDLRAEIPFGRPDIDYDLRAPDVPIIHNPFPASITGIIGHAVEHVTLRNITISYPGRGTRGMAYVPLTDLDRVPEVEKAYPEFHMFGELPAWGLFARHVHGLSIQRMTLHARASDCRPAYVLDDLANLSVISSEVQTADNHPMIAVRNVKNARIVGMTVNGQKQHVLRKYGTCQLIEQDQ